MLQTEVWLCFFLAAIGGFSGAGFASGIEPMILLDAAAYGSLLGAAVSLPFRAAWQLERVKVQEFASGLDSSFLAFLAQDSNALIVASGIQVRN